MSSLSMRKALAAAGALAIFAAAPVAAQSYDFADFGNSVFSYGYGTAGTSFTAFPNTFTSGCFGAADFACATAGSSSDLPAIGTNTGAGTLSFQTVDIPADTLFFHPGSATDGSDAILIFTAPTAGTYTISGQFLRLDNTPTGGNGVVLSAFVDGGFNSSTVLPNGPQFSSAALNGGLFLNAGDQLLLSVGNNGEYTYDSTGLQGSISLATVPEPATWGLMILGFGAVGATLRRRSTKVAYA